MESLPLESNKLTVNSGGKSILSNLSAELITEPLSLKKYNIVLLKPGVAILVVYHPETTNI